MKCAGTITSTQTDTQTYMCMACCQLQFDTIYCDTYKYLADDVMHTAQRLSF